MVVFSAFVLTHVSSVPSLLNKLTSMLTPKRFPNMSHMEIFPFSNVMPILLSFGNNREGIWIRSTSGPSSFKSLHQTFQAKNVTENIYVVFTGADWVLLCETHTSAPSVYEAFWAIDDQDGQMKAFSLPSSCPNVPWYKKTLLAWSHPQL